MTDEAWQTEVPKGIREIFELTVALKAHCLASTGLGMYRKIIWTLLSTNRNCCS
jgi:glycolate oxidase